LVRGCFAIQTAEKLSITLPAEMVRVIPAKVEGGAYASNSELVREAVRGWMERERHFAVLEAAIDRGIAAAEAGDVKSSVELRTALLARLGVEDAPTS
jgi:antitoxin ParD1/3/4